MERGEEGEGEEEEEEEEERGRRLHCKVLCNKGGGSKKTRARGRLQRTGRKKRALLVCLSDWL